MASQLRPEDKVSLLKGVTKKVGDRPYENGYWGSIAQRDYVLVELLNEAGTVIDYKDLTVAEAGIEVIDEQFKLLPGSHLTAFGFETGTFRIRYRFIRNLAGVEKPMLLRTKTGFENVIFEIDNDASNIHITEDKKIFGVSEEQYLQNPEAAERLFLTNFKYEVDAISPSRTEIRLKAKNIFDNSYLGEYRYQTDFLKLQESMKIENISSTIEFISVLNTQNTNPNDPPTSTDFNTTQDLQITTNNGGFAFTDNMKGGTLVLPNAYLMGYDKTQVKTDLNIIPNSEFESLELDLNTGEPKDISGIGWDPSLHSDAVQVKNWSNGYVSGTGVHKGTKAIGYHAKFVRNEGNSGGTCLKFIDQNNVFVDYDNWPTLNSHRRMMVGTTYENLDGLGANRGDIMNISFDMKSTVAGKGVTFQMVYPKDLFIEDAPAQRPEGYYNPDSPGPFEPQPEDPPEGAIPNTDAGALSLEPKPPKKASEIISFFNMSPPAYQVTVGHVSNDARFGSGPGAWKITEVISPPVDQAGEDEAVWSPNLSVDQTKEGTLTPGQDWKWDGVSWIESGLNTPPSYPTPDPDTVAASDYEGFDVVNAHPYQQPGNGAIPKFKRTTYPGENRGWQTGTHLSARDSFLTSKLGVPQKFKNENAFLLIKDDLVWLVAQPSYTADSSKIHLLTFDEMFPSILTTKVPNHQDTPLEEVVDHSIYEDIFKQGRIQSITRTRNVGAGDGDGDKTRSNNFIVFYNDGRGTVESNKAMRIRLAIGGDLIGGNANGVQEFKFIKDLDEGFNDVVSDAGGDMEWTYAGERIAGANWDHFVCVRGTSKLWRFEDGDGQFFDLTEGGQWFDATSGTANSFPFVFEGVHEDYFDVWFAYRHVDNHWSHYSGIERATANGGGQYIKLKSNNKGVALRENTEDWAYNAGVVGSAGAELEFGSRNPGATNYNENAIYDDGSSEFEFPENALKEGTLSPEGQWEWDGYQWNSVGGPPVYIYDNVHVKGFTNQAGSWDRYNVELEIPDNWFPLAKWYFYIRGHDAYVGEGNVNATTWVDNLYVDFTLTKQEISTPIYRDFTANITDVVSSDVVRVSRNYIQAAEALASEGETELSPVESINPISFDNFSVSYLVYNPYDLRTYLKFGSQMFLTTNFKKDKVSNGYPFSVVYKLYEPLPDGIQRNDELVVVKEMADMVEERIKVVDFIDTEVGDIVLKTPDLSNVESPVQRIATDYKTKDDVLTLDPNISDSLRNEFLSQSLDSVEINVDYSQFKNFVNFSSIKSRIENFKYKVEQIEAETLKSASYAGVSGSANDMNKVLGKINEFKNGFDGFEKYMYFQSSSYVTSSLGEFHDNAWPKTGGNGSFENPYILASSTSNQFKNWYSEQLSSASIFDTENFNKLSSLLPEHIKGNTSNQTFLRMTDMFGQHFDSIWLYIKALGDTYDRREKLTEGLSKDLLESVGKSLGWQLYDGKANVSLSRFALGKEVTGSLFSNFSTKPERDVSREIWSRIINNMPYFLKNKGSVRAIRGLISAYGIPSTILRVREYGGPDLPDNAVPQFEIGRKFTKALGFRGSQFVKTAWSDDSSSGRKPDTIEFRFKSPTGSNQILVEKVPTNPDVSSSFYIRLKDNGSIDNYGYVAFQISGSDGLKEISSSNLPIYDNDFYSVMVRRTSGSDNSQITQSFELSVGKYDAGRSKIHLYSTSTLTMPGDLNADSASYNANWETDGTIFIGGNGSDPLVGSQLSGSMMEYRHWTEVLNTGSFKNHIASPKAYNGNSLSSSYENLVLRYSFDDNEDLSTDTDGIRDVSANQTTTYSGSHSGFTGNFFHNVVDETKTHIPSIGALRRVTNKVRIEANIPKPGAILSYKERATKSAYDLAPVDSNKVGVYFAPTDVINTDIIESVANLNFDNFLGDPRDIEKLEYRGLKNASNHYWRKYNGKNDFWDYIRLLKYYDQSIFPQIRKMIPARAKASLGILVEPNIFERPKVVMSKKPFVESLIYRDTIKVPEFVEVTSSFNHDRFTITDYSAYDSVINLSNIDSGSNAVVSMSAIYKTYNGEVREFLDESYKNTIWQRIGKEGAYKSGSVTSGDIKFAEVIQPVISGSRIYGNNQKIMKFYNHPTSASLGIANSSSFFNVDIDNLVEHCKAKFDAYYAGVKNTKLTTFDGGPPVEVTITSPTRLVKSKGGESSLDTGEGKVAKFLPKRRKKKKGGFFQQSFAKTKPSSIQKAIKQAEEDKGDFLTFTETMEVVDKFNKENNIKKKKGKK